jgi:hypothetical protein
VSWVINSLNKYGENHLDMASQMRARLQPCCALFLISSRFLHIYYFNELMTRDTSRYG